jgi:nitrite reductase/ring-hydroxylating ferredoxin subunit
VALAADLERHGGEIFEHSRVRGVHGDRPVRLRLADGEVRADRVVLATGTPVLDRGGFFARLAPSRTYALALEVPGPLPQVMAIAADQPSRSLRTAEVTGGERLVVAGGSHPGGRAISPKEHVAELTRWATTHFPGARVTHRWSAQDYRGVDELPSVGPLLPGSDRVLVATGFDKWGLAMGVAAALALSSTVLEGHMPWARAVRTWRPNALTGLDRAVRLNAGVAARLVADRASPRVHSTAVVPPEGQGRVELQGPRLVAVSTVDGVIRRVSATCTHLGGVVSWNDADLSWDCPLHGSRFAADGAVLEGPATCRLRELHQR